MSTFPKYRYLYIYDMDSPWNCKSLTFPDWERCFFIIDLQEGMYLDKHTWRREDMEPEWDEVAEDPK